MRVNQSQMPLSLPGAWRKGVTFALRAELLYRTFGYASSQSRMVGLWNLLLLPQHLSLSSDALVSGFEHHATASTC